MGIYVPLILIARKMGDKVAERTSKLDTELRLILLTKYMPDIMLAILRKFSSVLEKHVRSLAAPRGIVGGAWCRLL